MLQFRKAEEKDIERIWQIYLENHIEEEAGKAVIGWNRNIYPTKATAEAALMRDDLFVLEDESGVMGTAVINQEQMDVYPLGNWQYDAADEEIMVLHTLVISTKASRKGYAKQMLKLMLEECKKINFEKVLICCDKENLGSSKTIIANGGILENEVEDTVGLTKSGIIQRYWINIK